MDYKVIEKYLDISEEQFNKAVFKDNKTIDNILDKMVECLNNKDLRQPCSLIIQYILEKAESTEKYDEAFLVEN